MKHSLILSLTLHAGLAAVAGAQQRGLPSVPQTLPLAEAISLARQHSPTLRQVANDRTAAAWGVRNAYAAFLPRFTANGSFNYRGSGAQTFLAEEFSQPSSTIGSSYGLSLGMQVSGQTFAQPALARARRNAVDATIGGAEISLESLVRQQYLAVLQAEAQVDLAEQQLTRNEEFLRLARARYDVGQNTMLDVRQAEVARGQAEVALLQARQAVTVEKLRLFQTIGVGAPDDPSVVSLSDTFPIVEPTWRLEDLLAEADAGNPDLMALRAQASAARANATAARSSWLPTLSLNAGWSGFTQQFTNIDPLVTGAVAGARATAAQQQFECEFLNEALLNPGEPALPCADLAFTPEDEVEIRDEIRRENQAFPFDFTNSPFSASITVSLPIFTQFSRPLQVAEASAQADDAREAVRARELQVRTDVSQAHYGLLTAYETIGIQETNRAAAREQLRLATERYRVGSGTFFELLDAQLAAQGAEADYISAVYAYHRAIATLESAVGHPLR